MTVAGVVEASENASDLNSRKTKTEVSSVFKVANFSDEFIRFTFYLNTLSTSYQANFETYNFFNVMASGGLYYLIYINNSQS